MNNDNEWRTASKKSRRSTKLDTSAIYIDLMTNFKVKEPFTQCNHTDTESLSCPNYHNPSEKRRPPNIYSYIPVLCDYRINCTIPDCRLAHTQNEVSFHPNLYKKYPCKNKNHAGYWLEKHRYTCTFLHDSDPEITDTMRKLALGQTDEYSPLPQHQPLDLTIGHNHESQFTETYQNDVESDYQLEEPISGDTDENKSEEQQQEEEKEQQKRKNNTKKRKKQQKEIERENQLEQLLNSGIAIKTSINGQTPTTNIKKVRRRRKSNQ